MNLKLSTLMINCNKKWIFNKVFLNIYLPLIIFISISIKEKLDLMKLVRNMDEVQIKIVYFLENFITLILAYRRFKERITRYN